MRHAELTFLLMAVLVAAPMNSGDSGASSASGMKMVRPSNYKPASKKSESSTSAQFLETNEGLASGYRIVGRPTYYQPASKKSDSSINVPASKKESEYQSSFSSGTYAATRIVPSSYKPTSKKSEASTFTQELNTDDSKLGKENTGS